jgi:hypothetical protein
LSLPFLGKGMQGADRDGSGFRVQILCAEEEEEEEADLPRVDGNLAQQKQTTSRKVSTPPAWIRVIAKT